MQVCLSKSRAHTSIPYSPTLSRTIATSCSNKNAIAGNSINISEAVYLSSRERELLQLSLCEARDRLVKGTTTSLELVRATIKNINLNNKKMNAFIPHSLQEQYQNSALLLAQQSDLKRKSFPNSNLGSLEGIPVCIKDNFSTMLGPQEGTTTTTTTSSATASATLPQAEPDNTTCASNMLRDYKSVFDSTISARLKGNLRIIIIAVIIILNLKLNE